MGCGMPPVRAVGDVSLHPPSPCHWLAPDAAAVALGLMVPVAAGLLIVPLAPVAALPASALVSARLHPAVPIASNTADAAIAMYFVVGFIAHASWYCPEPGPDRRINGTMDFSRLLKCTQIACLIVKGS